MAMDPQQEQKKLQAQVTQEQETEKQVASKDLKFPNPLDIPPGTPEHKIRAYARQNVNFKGAAQETKKA